MSLSTADPRFILLSEWLAKALRSEQFTLAPASEDASFRRYFRVTLQAPAALAPGAATLIAMDAPPPREDCRPFVHVATLMRDAGVNAPQVLAQDLARGFLLLTDLGPTTYLRALDAGNADDLFRDATDALLRWQLATREGVLPPYDEALLAPRAGAVSGVVRRPSSGADAVGGTSARNSPAVFALIIASNLAQPAVFVHRDYMPRNLMVSTPNPGVLDFQDAVCGPITYDIACLFRDAFVSWPEERVLDWTIRYWEKARRAGLPVAADIRRIPPQLRMDGPAAAPQGSRHLRAHPASRRQTGLRRGHAAVPRLRTAGGGTLPPARAAGAPARPACDGARRWRAKAT